MERTLQRKTRLRRMASLECAACSPHPTSSTNRYTCLPDAPSSSGPSTSVASAGPLSVKQGVPYLHLDQTGEGWAFSAKVVGTALRFVGYNSKPRNQRQPRVVTVLGIFSPYNHTTSMEAPFFRHYTHHVERSAECQLNNDDPKSEWKFDLPGVLGMSHGGSYFSRVPAC